MIMLDVMEKVEEVKKMEKEAVFARSEARVMRQHSEKV